jgi:5-(carboxyamino)imidazole ribonucleotide mutase
MIKVAIFIGSISDEDKMRSCAKVLPSLDIPYLFTVTRPTARQNAPNA